MDPVRLKIDPLQEVRIKKALQHHKGVCVWAAPTSEPDGPEVGTWLLSPRQMHQIHQAGGQPTRLTFSRAQLKKNLGHEGGFLPILASALIPIIGSAVGAIVENEIAGGSIPITDAPVHISRPSGTFYVQPQGEGLYLAPYPRRPRGHGLHMGDRNIKVSDVHHPEWQDFHKKILKSIS